MRKPDVKASVSARLRCKVGPRDARVEAVTFYASNFENREQTFLALAQNYDDQDCPVARALELVGERWTMLIIRDCFLGVSRFNDFLEHLDIPKATLSSRLDKLVDCGVLRRREYRAGQSDYLLTKQGEALWPVLYGLAAWGEAFRAPSRGPRRIFTHADCGAALDSSGACPNCKMTPPARDVVIQPGPGAIPDFRQDAVERALQKPHRFLTRLTNSESVGPLAATSRSTRRLGSN